MAEARVKDCRQINWSFQLIDGDYVLVQLTRYCIDKKHKIMIKSLGVPTKSRTAPSDGSVIAVSTLMYD